MNIFDIIGPVMIGPSSSHTAGAVRIGQIAKGIFARDIDRAKIVLYGSFAKTHKGHGTDKAIIGGLLGLKLDAPEIKHSFDLAQEAHMAFDFVTSDALGYHPNTAQVNLYDDKGNAFHLTAASVGGGRVMVTKINHLDVSFTCEYHTLIVNHRDQSGMVAQVANLLAMSHVNIAQMRTFRITKGGEAIMTIETDNQIKKEVLQMIESLDQVTAVTAIRAVV